MHRIVATRAHHKPGARGPQFSHAHPASGLAATHHTDSLARLCRLMVAAGYSGPAMVYGPDDRHRLTVWAIERLARLTLREEDERGLRWREHRDDLADGNASREAA